MPPAISLGFEEMPQYQVISPDIALGDRRARGPPRSGTIALGDRRARGRSWIVQLGGLIQPPRLSVGAAPGGDGDGDGDAASWPRWTGLPLEGCKEGAIALDPL